MYEAKTDCDEIIAFANKALDHLSQGEHNVSIDNTFIKLIRSLAMLGITYNQKKALFKQCKTKIELLKEDKMALGGLHNFNYLNWLESQIHGISYQAQLQQRRQVWLDPTNAIRIEPNVPN